MLIFHFNLLTKFSLHVSTQKLLMHTWKASQCQKSNKHVYKKYCAISLNNINIQYMRNLYLKYLQVNQEWILSNKTDTFNYAEKLKSANQFVKAWKFL